MADIGNDKNELYLAPMRNGRLLRVGERSSSCSTSSVSVSGASNEQIVVPPPPPTPTAAAAATTTTTTTGRTKHKEPQIQQHQHHRSNRNNHIINNNNTILIPRNACGWIPLTTKKSIILGRAEFLISLFASCGCSTNIYSSQNKCCECRMVMSWAGNLSRQMIQIEFNSNDNDNEVGYCSGSSTSTTTTSSCASTTLQRHPRLVVRSKGSRGKKGMLSPSVMILQCSSSSNSFVGGTPPASSTDDICSTIAGTIEKPYPSHNEDEVVEKHNNNYLDPCIEQKKKEIKNFTSDQDHTFYGQIHPKEWSSIRTELSRGNRISLRYEGEYHLDFLVVSREDYDSTKIDGSGSERDETLHDVFAVGNMANTSKITKMLRNLASHHNSDCKYQTNGQHPLDEDDDDNDNDNDNEWRFLPKSVGSQSLDQSCWLYHHRQHIQSSLAVPPSPTTIWFCPRGQDLPRKRIEILTKRLNSDVRNKVRVVEDFRDATHWVISGYLSSFSQIARVVKMSEGVLQEYLDYKMTSPTADSSSKAVTLVQPRWLDTTEGIFPLPPPSAIDLWYGYSPKSVGREIV
jgi:hypothetical protein